MKKIFVVLLTLSLLLGLLFTGCSTIKDKVESIDLEGIEEDVDEAIENLTETIGEGDIVNSGDNTELGKYMVDEITDEYTNPGVYGLSYTSKEKTDNIIDYFKELLSETTDYLYSEIPNIGALLKGTLNDKRITVSVQYDESGEVTFVEFYSYDE